jgi:hypothetical protein
MCSQRCRGAPRRPGFARTDPRVGYGLEVRGIPARLGIVSAGVLIAGCGTLAGGSSDTLSAVASASPVADASTSTGVVPSPSTAQVPASAPAADAVATMEDPDLSMRLPASWRSPPVATLRARAEQASAVTTGDIKEQYEQLILRIDANQIRLYAAGPSGLNPWQGTLVIEVTDAKSIDEQSARIGKLMTAFVKPKTSEQTEAMLAIGTGVRLEQTADPPAGQGVPARGINYIVKLDDGRIMWINSTGPEASMTFAGMIDSTVATISRR